jgi:hypothetical protein
MISMAVMPSVPAVHEDVHQRARQERKPNENSEHMCAMLGQQQRARDDQKSDQDEPRA